MLDFPKEAERQSHTSHNHETNWNEMKQDDDDDDDDNKDITLAHKYRLGLRTAPKQSSFRVVAVVFYELLGENKRRHVVGTNDEPCYINGSICAERAALVQLRFLPLKRIMKVVITTDASQPIFPGMLCREFMIGHSCINPESVAVVTAGSLCRRKECCLDIGTGSNSGDIDKLQNGCNLAGKYFHDWEVVRTTLLELYPHPSPYTRLDASESAKLGKLLSMSSSKKKTNLGTSLNSERILSKEDQILISEATKAATQGNDRPELHPIQYGAAILFDDGSIETACQRISLEYGCSLDAVTQLALTIERKRKRENEHASIVRPKLLVQTDQFGVIHTPFATARAYLSEFDCRDCQVLVQEVIQDLDGLPKSQITSVSVKGIAPSSPEMGDFWKE